MITAEPSGPIQGERPLWDFPRPRSPTARWRHTPCPRRRLADRARRRSFARRPAGSRDAPACGSRPATTSTSWRSSSRAIPPAADRPVRRRGQQRGTARAATCSCAPDGIIQGVDHGHLQRRPEAAHDPVKLAGHADRPAEAAGPRPCSVRSSRSAGRCRSHAGRAPLTAPRSRDPELRLDAPWAPRTFPHPAPGLAGRALALVLSKWRRLDDTITET